MKYMTLLLFGSKIAMSSKCPYPNCPGHPLALLQTCSDELCTNQLHHVRQTTTKHNIDIDNGLKKQCYDCLKPFLKCNKRKENETQTQQKEPSVGAPLIPPSSPPIFFIIKIKF